ncbi:MAG TPA: TonB-dependent receptor [Steroidobacteraceae bacterium]|nr:TonB-dependent receptor [Steroidobacteraceae bacterium]
MRRSAAVLMLGLAGGLAGLPARADQADAPASSAGIDQGEAPASAADLNQGGAPASTTDLKKLSIEQLMNVQVTSVSKRSEPEEDAPAAVYVITHDDIVRSGATSIPEILRLAPNLEVFQLSPSNYVVTARGFSGSTSDQNFSDKLLVLVDGRSVYSPLYSGVYWDTVDVMIEDIDRIEVISGPGATLWGANAVNGVINIITRKAAATTGASADVAYGSEERDGSAQFGGDAGADLSYRLYAKTFERDAFDQPSGDSADDAWSKSQAGFRTDWNGSTDAVTVQADGYHGYERQPGEPDLDVDGGNLTANWRRTLGGGTLEVLGYYDTSERETPGDGGFVLNTYDLEFQHSFDLGARNQVVWGGGDRISRYGITDTSSLVFNPTGRTLHLGDVFGQDTVRLLDPLKLTVGLKLEDDPYSGTTPLPDARLAWRVSDSAFLWTAVSHAIRSATPFDRDVAEYLANTLLLVGGPDFQPEKLTAYELGGRTRLGSQLSLSVSTFYNQYSDLRTIDINPTTVIPLQFGNGMKADTYGVELWGDYQVREGWRLTLGYTEQREHFAFTSPFSTLLGLAQAGDDPPRQAQLHSLLDLTSRLTFDAFLRYMGPLPDPAVRAYAELNARFAWRVSRNWSVAVTGSNLLHAHHEEFTVPPSDAISRSVLVSAEARF